jgi:hypothetical protein
MLLSGLVVSATLNIYLLAQPSTIDGIVDHKSVGEGTDNAGQPITWYTVSLWLVTDDMVNDIDAGETQAYIVDKEDFDKVVAGDAVKANPLRDVKMEIIETISRNEPMITIVRSEGRCGDLEKPLLSFEREGEYILLKYLESANVPCNRHIIDETVTLEKWPPIIEITLELESTSDVCIECIGTIETTLQVGPVPTGTEIVVNGLRVIV